MSLEAGAWYKFRSGSGLAWSWTFRNLVLQPFPTLAYSPTFVPAFYVNPDWPGLDPTVDPAVGMKCLVLFYANRATNFALQYRVQGGTWRLLQFITLIYGSFDYGNCAAPIWLPTLSELRIEMSGATAFTSTIEGVVTLSTR